MGCFLGRSLVLSPTAGLRFRLGKQQTGNAGSGGATHIQTKTPQVPDLGVAMRWDMSHDLVVVVLQLY